MIFEKDKKQQKLNMGVLQRRMLFLTKYINMFIIGKLLATKVLDMYGKMDEICDCLFLQPGYLTTIIC